MTLTELEKIVAERESSTLEFKATTGQRSDACKTLTGMLNGSGGRVFWDVAVGEPACRRLEGLGP